MIASFVAEDHRTWDVHVAEFQFALNSIDHDAIGFSPVEIIFNCNITDPLGNNIPSMETSDTTYLHKLELVRERIKRQQTRNKKFYDKRRREMNVQIGDKVMVKTFYLLNAKKNFSAKLAPRFKGPFEVTDFGHYKVNLKLNPVLDGTLLTPEHRSCGRLLEVDVCSASRSSPHSSPCSITAGMAMASTSAANCKVSIALFLIFALLFEHGQPRLLLFSFHSQDTI